MAQIIQAQVDHRNIEKTKMWRQLKQKEQLQWLAAAAK